MTTSIKLSIGLTIINIAIITYCIFLNINLGKYPPPDKLKRENGYIIHPVYGKYPEEVERGRAQ